MAFCKENSEAKETGLRNSNAGFETKEQLPQVNKDSGIYCWSVCFTAFLVNGIVFGIMNTFGILFAAMMKEFNEGDDTDTAFKIAWIGSINYGVMYLISPFSSLIIQLCGIKTSGMLGATLGAIGLFSSSFVSRLELLYLTFGTFVGIGSSLVFISSISILGHYFEKRIGLANGIAWSGGSMCTIALSFALKYMLRYFDLQWTLRFLAGLFTLLILCSLLWKPRNRNEENKSGNCNRKRCGHGFIHKLCNKTILKNKIFIVWVVAMSISLSGYVIAEIHLIQHTKDKFPKSDAEMLIISLAVTSFISRLVCGKLVDIPKVSSLIMLQITMIALGICNACIPFADTFLTLIVVVSLMGIFDGSYMGMQSLMAFDILGPDLAGQGTGYLFGFGAIPAVVGPPLAGLAYDYTDNYTISFIAAGITLLIGACVLVLAICMKRDMRKAAGTGSA